MVLRLGPCRFHLLLSHFFERCATMAVDSMPETTDASFAGAVTRLRRYLARPVDGASVATFRICFGVIMVWLMAMYLHKGVVRHYVGRLFHFTYELFPFVHPWPGQWMYLHFGVLALAAAGIALGFFYRLSALVFAVGYTYVFLLDKAHYQNHLYLLCLVSFLLFLTRAHGCASLDAWLFPEARSRTVPFWQLLLLRAQVGIVYFYGGIAKLNVEWLSGDTLEVYFSRNPSLGLAGPLMRSGWDQWVTYFLAHGGTLFDLSIPFALLWKRTRLAACFLVLFFHITNGLILYNNISIFPLLMICATVLFLEPDAPRRFIYRLDKQLNPNKPLLTPQSPPPEGPAGPPAPIAWGTTAFLGLYLAVQFLVPFRHFLYPGDVNWTEEGGRFAWRMKSVETLGDCRFEVIDPREGRTRYVNPHDELTAWQAAVMRSHPDMILQYAHHLAEKFRTDDGRKPVVHAIAWKQLNRRPLVDFIDPNVDLAQVRFHFRPFERSAWILDVPPRTPGRRP